MLLKKIFKQILFPVLLIVVPTTIFGALAPDLGTADFTDLKIPLPGAIQEATTNDAKKKKEVPKKPTPMIMSVQDRATLVKNAIETHKQPSVERLGVGLQFLSMPPGLIRIIAEYAYNQDLFDGLAKIKEHLTRILSQKVTPAYDHSLLYKILAALLNETSARPAAKVFSAAPPVHAPLYALFYVLEQHNVDLNIQDTHLKWNILHEAAFYGHNAMVVLLVNGTIFTDDQLSHKEVPPNVRRSYFAPLRIQPTDLDLKDALLNCADQQAGATELIIAVIQRKRGSKQRVNPPGTITQLDDAPSGCWDNCTIL